MGGKAAKIQLTDRMHDILQEISSSRNAERAIGIRAQVILMGFAKEKNKTIAQQLGVSQKTAGLWRRRWRDSFSALLQMQFAETGAGFRRALMECLRDAPRSGSSGKFTAEQIVSLIA